MNGLSRTFSLLRRLRNRFTFSRRATRRDQRINLFLEALEDRLVPTVDIWTGLGAANHADPNPNWSDRANWANNVLPTSGDSISFPSVAMAAQVSNNDLLAGTQFGSVTISGGGYDITGNGIALTDHNALYATNTYGVDTFGLPITLTSAQIINTSKTGGSLTLTGAINNNGNTLTANSDADLTFSGSISGTGGFVAEGGAKIILAAPNSYTGVTSVYGITLYLNAPNAIVGNVLIGNGDGPTKEADVLRLADDNAIKATSNVTILDNGLLSLDGHNNTIASLTMTGGNVDTGTGTLALSGGTTINADPNPAVIAGNLALELGVFLVQPGSSKDNGIGLNVQAVISNGTGATLTKQGDGTMQLDPVAEGMPADNSYTGQTVVSAGRLRVNSANALGAVSAGATVDHGGILVYVNANTGSPVAFAPNPLTLNGGELQVSGSASLSGPITLNGDSSIAVNTGDTLDLTDRLTGSGGFTKLWTGALDLGAADNYSGATEVQSGILALDNAHALSGSETKVDGPGTLELEPLANNQSYAAVSLALSGTLLSNGNFTWSSPITLTGNPKVEVAGNDQLTLSGSLSGSGSLIIGDPKDPGDNGTVLLTGANSYQGAARVDLGVLAVTNADALSSETTVDSGASLQFLGGSTGLTFATAKTLHLNGFGVNGAGALQNVSGNNTWDGTLDLATNTALDANTGTTLTFNGLVRGTGNFTIGQESSTSVDGTVLLTRNNTYSGYTIVDSGILAIAAPSALGIWTTGTTVNNGATLQLQGGPKGQIQYDKEGLILYGNGYEGRGALENLSGDNSIYFPTQLYSPTTVTCEAGSSLTDFVQFNNDGFLLTVNAAGAINFHTSITGTGGLIKNGADTLTLSGPAANLFGGNQKDGTGSTTITAGVLLLDKPASVEALGGASVTVMGNATLAGTGTIDANVINNGVVSPGGPNNIGTLVIHGDYTQTMNGVLDMELKSQTAFDQLLISGDAYLDGTLNVSLLDGFVPKADDTFTLMTFGKRSGSFATINLPDPGNGVVLSVVYDPMDLTIDTSKAPS